MNWWPDESLRYIISRQQTKEDGQVCSEYYDAFRRVWLPMHWFATKFTERADAAEVLDSILFEVLANNATVEEHIYYSNKRGNNA